jgi:3-hydroxypropanoate dehydrogenase
MANVAHAARTEELALLFTAARTHYAWLPEPVDDDLLRRLYELVRWAPTGSNAQTMRIAFVRSPEGKERLRPALFPANVEKAMTAPVTAILAYDVAWYERMPELAPFRPNVLDQYLTMPAERRDQLAALNSHVQAGYFILAARAVGLDCGPMGGFDRAKVDAAFFPNGAWHSQLLVNLGYGDPEKTMARMPRLDFETVCRLV